jgi:hypothetical protein
VAKEAFIERKFRPDSIKVIEQANAIIAAYQAQGFTLTLRQLYYQFVSRDLLRNRQSEYKRLGSIISDARLAGLIDWDAIEDRTRNVRFHNAWSSPQAILDAVASQYQENPWGDQRWRPEVWIEKDALIGVVEPVCNRWRIPYYACRGYASQSEQYAAGQRFRRLKRQGFMPIILHLGDHDPSGLDMTRDNADRVSMFTRWGVEVRRLALNMDQIEQYDPPPNPAKDTDARFADYQARYGDESWELDALEPQVIDVLIETEVNGLVNREAWDASLAREEDRKAVLQAISNRYDDVADMLGFGDEDED